jgi:transposase
MRTQSTSKAAKRSASSKSANKNAASSPDERFYLKPCLGLDLGDRVHHFCLVTADGRVAERGAIPNKREALTGLAQKFRGHRIVLECGAQSSWISHHLKDTGCGMEVVVANARKVQLISQDTRKCDAHDAEHLARLGRADTSLLSPITHRGLDAQRHLSLVRMRDCIVRQRVALVNNARGLLKCVGEAVPGADPSNFARKCRDQLAADVLETVAPLLAVLDCCAEQIRLLERRIDKLIAKQYPEAARLMEINGVGPLTALTFVLTVDDAHRFARPRDIGGFLGLVPRRDQSGAKDKQLGITRQGDGFLRKLLVNCAQTILGPFGQDCDLRRWGLAKLEQRQGVARNQIVLAVSRKLAVLMLSVLKSGQAWRPLRLAETSAAAETENQAA